MFHFFLFLFFLPKPLSMDRLFGGSILSKKIIVGFVFNFSKHVWQFPAHTSPAARSKHEQVTSVRMSVCLSVGLSVRPPTRQPVWMFASYLLRILSKNILPKHFIYYGIGTIFYATLSFKWSFTSAVISRPSYVPLTSLLNRHTRPNATNIIHKRGREREGLLLMCMQRPIKPGSQRGRKVWKDI